MTQILDLVDGVIASGEEALERLGVLRPKADVIPIWVARRRRVRVVPRPEPEPPRSA